jgi:hypothetical protein
MDTVEDLDKVIVHVDPSEDKKKPDA